MFWRFSSSFTPRKAVPWSLSAMPCNHLWANHQNVDPDILSKVLLQRKVIPFLAHLALQVLCWLFFRPRFESAQMSTYPDLELLCLLGNSEVKNFTQLRPTQAGNCQLTPTTSTLCKVKTNFSASHS